MRFPGVAKIVGVVCLGLLVVGCANRNVADVSIGDSGQSYKVKFGTVLAARPVNIRSDYKDAIGIGAASGGIFTVITDTSSSFFSGVLAGGAIGAAVHHIAETENGIAYMIAFSDGSTQVINQLQGASDPVFRAGHSVVVTFGATRNVVLDATSLPNRVRHPKKVVVDGAPAPKNKIDVRHCQQADVEDTSHKSCTLQ